MKPIQIKMARVAVGWGVRELAAEAGVTANTITRIENGADAKQSTMDAIQGALERRGVIFTHENGEIGVKFSEKTVLGSSFPVDKDVVISVPNEE